VALRGEWSGVEGRLRGVLEGAVGYSLSWALRRVRGMAVESLTSRITDYF